MGGAAYEGAACHEIGFNWRQGNKRVKLGSPLTLAVNAGWSHCHYLLARCSTLTLTAALTIYSVAAPYAVKTLQQQQQQHLEQQQFASSACCIISTVILCALPLGATTSFCATFMRLFYCLLRFRIVVVVVVAWHNVDN